MERRLKLKSMKRTSSHRLKITPDLADNSNTVKCNKITSYLTNSFDLGNIPPSNNSLNNGTNGCYSPSLNHSDRVSDDKTHKLPLNNSEKCPQNGKVLSVFNPKIVPDESVYSSKIASKNGVKGVLLQRSNTFTDGSLSKSVDINEKNFPDNTTKIISVNGNMESEKYFPIEVKFLKMSLKNAPENKNSEENDDSEVDEDDSSAESDGVTVQLTNYKNNEYNHRINSVNNYETIQIIHSNGTNVDRNSSNAPVADKNSSCLLKPELELTNTGTSASPKRTLTKSKSLNMEGKELVLPVTIESFSQIPTPVKARKGIVKNHSTSSLLALKKQISSSNDSINDITKLSPFCLNGSSQLCRIDEHGSSNLLDENDPCLENGTFQGNPPQPPVQKECFSLVSTPNQTSSANSQSPQLVGKFTTGGSRAYKIRHSKSDVHLISSAHLNGDWTGECSGGGNHSRESSQSRPHAIRRSKSRHEGQQIFGFRIDGFAVRKLGQFRKRATQKKVEELSKHPSDVLGSHASSSGCESGGTLASSDTSEPSEFSEVDGASLSKRNSRAGNARPSYRVFDKFDNSDEECCSALESDELSHHSAKDDVEDRMSSKAVGGAFKRAVQLLRSRSAVSQRDRPNLGSSRSPSSRIIGPGKKKLAKCFFIP